jgi:hypothetical protein
MARIVVTVRRCADGGIARWQWERWDREHGRGTTGRTLTRWGARRAGRRATR